MRSRTGAACRCYSASSPSATRAGREVSQNAGQELTHPGVQKGNVSATATRHSARSFTPPSDASGQSDTLHLMGLAAGAGFGGAALIRGQEFGFGPVIVIETLLSVATTRCTN